MTDTTATPSPVPNAVRWQPWHELRRRSSQCFLARDLDGAIAAEREALALAEAQPADNERVAQGLRALASIHALSGQFETALPLFERLLALAAHGVNVPDLDVIRRDCEEVRAVMERQQGLA